uniref:Uncharacterized protein n=1 Tax=Phaeodactylum tricornutum TaxID=2850 RepID=A0A8J9T8K0_PHATR
MSLFYVGTLFLMLDSMMQHVFGFASLHTTTCSELLRKTQGPQLITQLSLVPNSVDHVEMFNIASHHLYSFSIADAATQLQKQQSPQELGQTKTETTLIFVAGLVPFVWATVEFWRRIAVGESFGTGSDSIVIIGEDDAPESSRGRRVLGKGALFTAYVLFTISAAVLGIVLFSVLATDTVSFEEYSAGLGETITQQ